MKISSLIIFFLFLSACSVEPKKIEFGRDACHFCKMTIVDTRHASEMVTKKGKVFKYDAIECMINESRERDLSEIALWLVSDFDHPGEFLDAPASWYLVSEAIPSPMGESLSAFGDSARASDMASEHGGSYLSWTELRKKLE